ncbi:XRE family transcriptional regulator [Stakelama sp. CBK3Z-3]|uniref:XRE family transcriptional regulator n=1 Tax=Stakelama flava TaxID=2860338 RepID=A0ABS6XGU1_9SPHN|nr:XRE family transcriptional regulator [Stakelama flava]MBW4329426.1 XRE family transcriptional regulator [Stakelama flava]
MPTVTSDNRLGKPIPERIKEAREARGLSGEQLAEMIGVSRQAVAQYETGQITPGPDALRAIIAVTGQSLSFFTTLPARPSDPQTPFFRSLKRMESHHRRRIYRRLQWAGDILSFLERFIELPSVNLPDFEFDPWNDDFDQIEVAAEMLRDHWGLGRGPIRQLAHLLEANGIFIVRESVKCSDMDAVSCWIGGRALALLSSEVESGPRDLFNLAHELGHICLHAGVEVTSENLDKIEKQAHAFAGAFLLPQETFSKEVLGTSLGYFISLKERWGVSIAAMAMRCKSLSIFSENQQSYLFRQMNTHKIRKIEPLDDKFPVNSPHVMGEAMKMLIEHRVCSIGEIEENLGLNMEDVEELCGLEKGVLDQKVVPFRLKE